MKLFKKTAGIAMSLALLAAMILPVGVRAADETGPIPDIVLSIGKSQETPVYTEGDKKQELLIRLKNEGTADAKNVKIAPIIDDASAWPFEITNVNNEFPPVDIPVGETVETKLGNLTVRADAGEKNYKLTFQITCNDGKQQYETTKYVYVKTLEKKKPAEDPKDDPKEEPKDEPNTPEEPQDNGGISNNEPVITSGGGGGEAPSGNNSVPRVIVTGFNTEPGAVNAGSDFKLIVHLKNTSTRTAVSNMLFDLQAPSSGTEGAAEAPAFLPSSGSSTIYLDSIPAGGTQDISIDLNARADLVQKPYSISMSMKYEDSSATQYEGSSSLAIPVKQAARFEFSELEIAPEAVAVGEEANITCSLYNTGRIKLYNVKVKFEGEGIEAKEVFVGNVDSGATGSIDGIVTAMQETAGNQKFKMIVSYEDDAGKASTVEKEFSLQITPEQAPMDVTTMAEMPEEKGYPLIPVIIAVVVVAAVIVTIIVMKKRKKKKESVEEVDLVDEVDRFTEDE